MEASVAAGGAPAAAQGADGGESGENQATAPDYAALQSKFDAMEGTQKEMFEWMQSQAASTGDEEQGPEEAALAEMDLSFLDDTNPAYDPEQAAANLASLIERAADQKVEARMAPIEQRVAAGETARAVDSLVAELPELGKPEVATEVIKTAKAYAEQMGRPDLAGDPQMWKLVYLAGRAADQANAEGEEPGVAHLEGANGASPGGGSQVDLGDAIVNAGGKGSSVLPFG